MGSSEEANEEDLFHVNTLTAIASSLRTIPDWAEEDLERIIKGCAIRYVPSTVLRSYVRRVRS